MNKLIKKTTIGALALMIAATSNPVYALSKNETVYSKLNSDGSVKKTVVSEFLKANGETGINDITNLKDILNINGEETFKIDGNNITFDNKGNDIYYQGTTKKELPVSLNITYELNGKEIKLKDLLGKKGNVTIKLNYKNNDAHKVNVNGTYKTLYTPFVVTMGTIISNDENSNVTVTNGKVVSNGSNSVVVALASPGLYESLKNEQLKDLDTITINYDTTNFKLGSMYSVVSSNLINKDDIKVFDRLDSVYSKMNTLSESSTKLVNGSNELVEGATKLQNGTNTYAAGVTEAYKGSKTINDTLNAKLEETKNSTAIDEQTLAYIKTKASTEAVSTVESQEDTIKTQGQNGVDAYITELNKQITEAETKNPALQTIFTSVMSGNVSDQIAPYLANEDVQKYIAAKKIYAALQDEATKALVKQVAGEVAYGTASKTASETASKTSVTVANQVADSAKTKTVESLNTLSAGINKLTIGLDKLNSNSSLLTNGTNNLVVGAQKLNNGMTAFDKEGIQNLTSLVNGTVKGTEEEIKALVKLGNDYQTFTMKNKDTEGETKFILMVDAQSKKVETKTAKTTKKSEKLVDKIKNLFK